MARRQGMMRGVGWLLCGLLCAVPAAAQPAGDRDDEAHSLFQSATLAFQAGHYEAALARFREARELSGRATLYFNIGITADRLRRNEEALEAFQRYLADVPDAANRAEVEGRVRVLEKILAERRAHSESDEAVGGEARASAAPTPEQAAEAAVRDGAIDMQSGTPEPSEAKRERITSRWWFWTAAGVVVLAAAGLGVGLAVGGGGTENPIPGSNGESYQALVKGP